MTEARTQRLKTPLLFVTVLIIATSGLVYELLAGTVASYVLGDSVTQFSTTIGTYLFAMGIGSFLSRYVKKDVARRFVEVELSAAILGGMSAPLLFLGFATADAFEVLLYTTILAIGTLVGLEIPLLMRILREELAFEELVAKVLTFDYVGALLGSVLFALLFVPTLGLTRTSLFFGLLNAVVALVATHTLRDLIDARARRALRVVAGLIMVILGVAFWGADRFTQVSEERLYGEPIVYSDQSPFQRIVVTQSVGTQLYLNGHLQLSTADEHRYHEALVHPAFSIASSHRRVLVLGGGDGFALREIFRYPGVEEVTLVDLDEAVVRMARRVFAEHNKHSLDDPRLEIVHDDAMVWLDEGADGTRYDVVIIDFPDPGSFSLGKLYTRRFYHLVERVLAPDGALVVQSTSPLYARRSFWCIDATLRASGFVTQPYHANVPSFGEWGFVLAKRRPFDVPTSLRISGLRYLDEATLRTLFVFPRDMDRVPVRPNALNEQTLVRYYDAEVRQWDL
ncbi:MAG: polyamine aminopropyltransferase [Myxococcota bacterium]